MQATRPRPPGATSTRRRRAARLSLESPWSCPRPHPHHRPMIAPTCAPPTRPRGTSRAQRQNRQRRRCEATPPTGRPPAGMSRSPASRATRWVPWGQGDAPCPPPPPSTLTDWRTCDTKETFAWNSAGKLTAPPERAPSTDLARSSAAHAITQCRPRCNRTRGWSATGTRPCTERSATTHMMRMLRAKSRTDAWIAKSVNMAQFAAFVAALGALVAGAAAPGITGSLSDAAGQYVVNTLIPVIEVSLPLCSLLRPPSHGVCEADERVLNVLPKSRPRARFASNGPPAPHAVPLIMAVCGSRVPCVA
jgi:hypothetical protein